MKALILKYKSVIKFILTFLLVYSVLSLGYNWYLNVSKTAVNSSDYVSYQVAKQSESLLNAVGYKAQVVKHAKEPSMKLIVRGKYVARVIEGCNSLSIIILFISFVVAFSGRFKTTALFIIFGSVIIYVVNILRIVILSVGLYHYPWRSELLHVVVFPGIIYGMVFLLWMLWVNKFSNIGKNKS